MQKFPEKKNQEYACKCEKLHSFARYLLPRTFISHTDIKLHFASKNLRDVLRPRNDEWLIITPTIHYQ